MMEYQNCVIDVGKFKNLGRDRKRLGGDKQEYSKSKNTLKEIACSGLNRQLE